MSDPTDTPLKSLLHRLLADAIPRTDHDQPGLATPHSPDPWLIQSSEGFVALAVGVELLDALAQRGGTTLPQSALSSLKGALLARFNSAQRAHLEEEVMRIWLWLDEQLTRRPLSTRPHDTAREDGWRLIIEEAIEESRDLLLSRLDEARHLFLRSRIRPERLEEDEDEGWMLIGWFVPSGGRFEAPLASLRWLIKIERFQSLASTHTADIVMFPGGGGAFGGENDEP